mgnify:CR=1 FL=1
MLISNNITIQFGAKPLFENVSVKFGDGILIKSNSVDVIFNDKIIDLSYSIFDLNLSGNYSVTTLPITPLDENARIPEGVLASNLKTINDRLVQLRSDFKSITDTFYFGKSNANSNTSYNVIASVEDGDDFSVQVVTKDSVMVSKVATPSSQLADVQSKAVESVSNTLTQSSTDLAKKISANEETLKSAQAGDTQAQDELRRQLTQSQQALKDTNLQLLERLKAKGINI